MCGRSKIQYMDIERAVHAYTCAINTHTVNMTYMQCTCIYAHSNTNAKYDRMNKDCIPGLVRVSVNDLDILRKRDESTTFPCNFLRRFFPWDEINRPSYLRVKHKGSIVGSIRVCRPESCIARAGYTSARTMMWGSSVFARVSGCICVRQTVSGW